MTWPDVIRSVTARIHDVAAQDRELRVLYRERMTGFESDSTVIYAVHCTRCEWDSGFMNAGADADDEPYCLHCGASEPDVIEIERFTASR